MPRGYQFAETFDRPSDLRVLTASGAGVQRRVRGGVWADLACSAAAT